MNREDALSLPSHCLLGLLSQRVVTPPPPPNLSVMCRETEQGTECHRRGARTSQEEHVRTAIKPPLLSPSKGHREAVTLRQYHDRQDGDGV